MKVYSVTYRTSDYGKENYTVNVAAPNLVRAAQAISKQKYIRYSGYVESVTEALGNVVIAK